MTFGDSTAFPAATSDLSGLTKREYFAALMLAGMMSENPTMGLTPNRLSLAAVEYADHLIDALNQEAK
jgi:hypothetical protein